MPITNPTPPVSCQYGAPLGRYRPYRLNPAAGKLYLRRIRLNSGGYDSGGAYWGHGQPLFWVEDQECDGYFFRAADRDAAKRQIALEWPGATFYR